MADATKVLGQANPSATTLTDLYTVPAGKKVTAALFLCNRSTVTTYRVAIAPAGAADDPKHYIAYDVTIGDNQPASFGPLALAPSDVVRVYATLATLSFTLTGIES